MLFHIFDLLTNYPHFPHTSYIYHHDVNGIDPVDEKFSREPVAAHVTFYKCLLLIRQMPVGITVARMKPPSFAIRSDDPAFLERYAHLDFARDFIIPYCPVAQWILFS